MAQFQYSPFCKKRHMRFSWLTAFLAAGCLVHGKEIEEYVNILGGTTPGNGDLSHGNTLPLMARPWGFNHWAPQSNGNNDGWWFKPTDYRYYGVRLTHQPSPWMGDWAHMLIQTKLQDLNHADDRNFPAGYDPLAAVWSPYYFKAVLAGYESSPVEFTPTRHGAITYES
jgi:putative alpha-1,2-mannosidase